MIVVQNKISLSTCYWECFQPTRRFSGRNLLMELLVLGLVMATIDINLPEYEYLSDHLTPHQCRVLITALHDPGYDVPNDLDIAERKVPDDITCLKLLLHWNSALGEGRGQSHVVLGHRLHQIGRQDLAEWLSKTVFHQLGQDLNQSLLSNPFRDTGMDNDTLSQLEMESKTMAPPVEPEEPDQWVPMDTILCVIVISLVATIIGFIVKIAWEHCCKRHIVKIKEKVKFTPNQAVRKRKTSSKRNNEYEFSETALVLREETSSDDEPVISMLHTSKPSEKKSKTAIA